MFGFLKHNLSSQEFNNPTSLKTLYCSSLRSFVVFKLYNIVYQSVHITQIEKVKKNFHHNYDGCKLGHVS